MKNVHGWPETESLFPDPIAAGRWQPLGAASAYAII